MRGDGKKPPKGTVLIFGLKARIEGRLDDDELASLFGVSGLGDKATNNDGLARISGCLTKKEIKGDGLRTP